MLPCLGVVRSVFLLVTTKGLDELAVEWHLQAIEPGTKVHPGEMELRCAHWQAPARSGRRQIAVRELISSHPKLVRPRRHTRRSRAYLRGERSLPQGVWHARLGYPGRRAGSGIPCH